MSEGAARQQDPERGLFRPQAVEHHARGREHGDVLRLPPAWTRWAYPLLLAACLAGLVFLVVGRVSVYAGGPAVVRVAGSEDLVAPAAGTIAAVVVMPGDAVAAGDAVARLHDERERADLERARREFEGNLVERLRDPGNEAARRALISWKAELELARARLDARSVRAPRAGHVGDIGVREGQTVREGDLVATLVADASRPTLVALLPGHALPQLAVGQELDLALEGYPQSRLRGRLVHVPDRVVGPAEARRFLGQEIGDGLEVAGPVVIVRAELEGDGFDVLGTRYGLYDGMVGRAEVRVRREPLLLAIAPGLRRAFGP